MSEQAVQQVVVSEDDGDPQEPSPERRRSRGDGVDFFSTITVTPPEKAAPIPDEKPVPPVP